MTDRADTAQVVIRPPIAWLLAVLVGLALDWLMPLPFMPAALPAGWIGGAVFAVALALFAWAIATITRAGSNVPTSKPTTTIVDTGPYRFTRNPIYLGMFLGLVGLAMAFDSLWLLAVLVPFALSSSVTGWWPARKPVWSASSTTSIAGTARASDDGCNACRHSAAWPVRGACPHA
jgi:protein-S-isoprenylcysteine O-methyltransferase Ste14